MTASMHSNSTSAGRRGTWEHQALLRRGRWRAMADLRDRVRRGPAAACSAPPCTATLCEATERDAPRMRRAVQGPCGTNSTSARPPASRMMYCPARALTARAASAGHLAHVAWQSVAVHGGAEHAAPGPRRTRRAEFASPATAARGAAPGAPRSTRPGAGRFECIDAVIRIRLAVRPQAMSTS